MTTAAPPEELSLLERIALLPESEQKQLLESLNEEAATELLASWRFWARPSQLPPPGDWLTWLIQTGRGWGKTRTGAEWVRQKVKDGFRRGALVGSTTADVRDVMIEGESGILEVTKYDPEESRPTPEYGHRRISWPNGAFCTIYSAEEPRRLRGPQHEFAWGDEPAAWQYAETLDQLMLGLRLGTLPQVLLTTTPKPLPLIIDLNNRAVLDAELRSGARTGPVDVVMTVGSTYENIANLARKFISEVVRKYEGTTLGEQELYARLIRDVEGAQWTSTLLERTRVKGDAVPQLRRICIGVDPAVTSKKTSAETGIVVAGLGVDGHAYVLRDASGRLGVNAWGTRVVELYGHYGADRVIAEVNNGGDMVETVIRNIDSTISYKGVPAARGKDARAEPIVGLYEQNKVHHVGYFGDMESQMTTWRPDLPGMPSPDRMDALVWVLTELMLGGSRVFVVG